MTKEAFIIGITGQDGSFLAEYLLEKGYLVHGLVRRSSLFSRSRIDHLRDNTPSGQSRLKLHYGDLSDLSSLRRIIQQVRPQEIYHLGGQSHVGVSFEIPEATCAENGMATIGILEILRDLSFPVRLFHASSSEIFGTPEVFPQTETTPLNPTNPYGCSKAFATQMCRIYRKAYGLFVCNGIAYNHESPRRPENFVTRKISSSVAKIKVGQASSFSLGNLEAARDWGYAGEYVQAMHSTLQNDAPGDYVLATGKVCSVREFATAAFATVGIEIVFEGQGLEEVGRCSKSGDVLIRVEPRYYRPLESTQLVGNAQRAWDVLGWKPKIYARELAALMVRADLDLVDPGQKVRRS